MATSLSEQCNFTDDSDHSSYDSDIMEAGTMPPYSDDVKSVPSTKPCMYHENCRKYISFSINPHKASEKMRKHCLEFSHEAIKQCPHDGKCKYAGFLTHQQDYTDDDIFVAKIHCSQFWHADPPSKNKPPSHKKDLCFFGEKCKRRDRCPYLHPGECFPERKSPIRSTEKESKNVEKFFSERMATPREPTKSTAKVSPNKLVKTRKKCPQGQACEYYIQSCLISNKALWPDDILDHMFDNDHC